MRLLASHDCAIGIDALMRLDHRHIGRLADDDGAGTWQVLAEPRDQRPHSGAADLLVVGDDDVDRLLQLARGEERHGRENASDEPLHVAGAAAIELAVARGQREGIARPGLAFYRNAVAMAGEPNPSVAVSRPDGCEQARLRPVWRRGQRRGDAATRESVAHEIDQLEIRLGARRVEGDQRGQQLLRYR